MRAQRLKDEIRLLRLSARLLMGKRFWLVPLFTILWPTALWLFLLWGWTENAYVPTDAQTGLIGTPLTVLGIFLGGKVIAGEIDKRTLEIAYTVPGGAHRIWISKLIVCVLTLAVAEALLAGAAYAFFTDYPLGALYGAMQSALFYLVLSMSLAALFKSEASGGLVVIVVLLLNWLFTGFGANQIRISPFWNPAVLLGRGRDPADVLAWTVQNRIGFLFAIAAVIAMGFTRAERREKLL
ncbi:MAG: hypothetical protein IFK94_04735 [Acidobacteria bacterium]|uniref:Uncharacterized protein n=1 Tax=Candidatus Polarisedimenticola svalbardensis TaxID=2886004 RepID=A0A8J6Y5D9_9BACT|nr:hypothetical protein [Candidatus Polarisedimenticola svalbardensis]